MTNSRQKGARGERELAKLLSDAGYPARRGQQFSGGTDSPDVVCPGLGFLHFECKLTQALQLYAAMAQATRDAGTKIPVVAHRKNGEEWVAILPLKDLLRIIKMRAPDNVAPSQKEEES